MSVMEQSVIGACLLDPKAYWTVADILRSEDFANPDDATLFRAIAKTAADGNHLDAVATMDVLPELSTYATMLANNVAGSANARFYAQQVAKESVGRRVRLAGQQIATLDTDDALGEAARLIAGIEMHCEGNALPVKAYLRQMVGRMQERCDNPGRINGVRTGIPALDQRLGGLENGTLNVLAARPSMGKTALAMQIAAHAANDGHVLVISLETTGEKLSERLVSHLSGVSHKLIREPHKIPEESWGPILTATSRAEKLKLTIDEGGSHTAQSIAARAHQVNMQDHLSLIVVDHLGLIQLPHRRNQAEEVGDITRAFKMLAKSINCPVLTLVQLNRRVEETQDKRPQMSHLRDSGRIEEDADSVLMLYRPGYYFPEQTASGIAEIICRKVRDGETGTVYTRAQLDHMTFTETDEPEYTNADIQHFSGRGRRGFGSHANQETRSFA